MTRVSLRRATLTTAVMLASLLGVHAPASAQGGFSLRGGSTVDPDQAFFGMEFISSPLTGDLRVQPGADLGFGDDLTLACLHIDFAQWFPINPRWQLYFGGGPTVDIYRFDLGDAAIRDVQGGFETLVGFAHDSGVTLDLRVGSGGTPTLRFSVGYTFR